jgi:crotonyl-CoA carboxylase/reductase
MYDKQTLDNTKVQDVMHRGVMTCSLHAPLTAVARTMAAHRIHCVVVWNEPARNEAAALWGVVSDLDLVKIAAEQEMADCTAGGSASTPALMIAPDETLRRAAQLMAEYEVTHLVVVNHAEKPVGVLSTLDLAGVLSDALEPAIA